MKKLYDKNELSFALIWIGLYVVLFSVADSASSSVGIVKSVTAPLCIIMSMIIYFWISKNGLKEKYGLCRFVGSAKDYLYFIPLVFIVTTNIWFGFKMNLSVLETLLYIVSMIGVGFLEEIVFRGFLFEALYKTNGVKSAVLISSITFGLGHIVNLLNGKDVPETLMQVCYAVAIGFLFTIIFYRGKSLWPCIIAHSVINSLSVFANKEAGTMPVDIAVSIFLCVASVAYALFILKRIPKD